MELPEIEVEDLPPDFQKRYRLVERLGGGAVGDVFRARTARGQVVVKLVDGEDLDGVQADRVLQEAELLGELDHPHVVRLLDHGMAGPWIYLIFPDEGGRALREFKADYVGDALKTQRTLADILRGLGAMHDRGVVHRDVKPANVVVLPDGTAKLIDLGIAKPLGSEAYLTQTGDILGTPAYMAPGQIDGKDPDPRDDLYSAGVVAYELFTGENPFRGDTPAETLLHQVSREPPRMFRRHPEAGVLAEVVDALLAKDRDERYQDAESARVALERPIAPPRPSQVARALEEDDDTAMLESVPVIPPRGVGPRLSSVAPAASGPPLRLLAAGAGGLLVLALLGFLVGRLASPGPDPGAGRLIWPEGLPEDWDRAFTRELRAHPPLDDPFARAELPRRVAAYGAFVRWARDRDLAALEPAAARRLRDLDQILSDLGHPGEFLRYLAPPAPEGGRRVPGGLRRVLGEQLYFGATPVQAGPRAAAALGGLGALGERGASPGQVLPDLLGTPSARRAREQEQRPVARLLEPTLVALGRALRAGEPASFAALVQAFTVVTPEVMAYSVACLGPEVVAATTLDAPASQMLAALILARGLPAYAAAGGTVPRRRAQLDAVLDGLVGTPGDSPDATWLRFQALRLRLEAMPPEGPGALEGAWDAQRLHLIGLRPAQEARVLRDFLDAADALGVADGALRAELAKRLEVIRSERGG